MSVPRDARETEFSDALRVDVGLAGYVSKAGVCVAGVAEPVIGRTKKLISKTQVQGKRLADAVIILRKPRVTWNAVIVVAQATAAFTQEGSTRHEALEVRAETSCTGDKENQSVVGDWQAAAHSNAVNLSAKAELVRSAGPTHSVDPSVVIGQSRLQLRWVRAKGKAIKLKPVYVGIARLPVYSSCSGQVNAHLRIGNWWLIIQLVADDVYAEAEFIDQTTAEYMCIGDAAEAAMQRNVQGEIQVVGTGLASSLDPVRNLHRRAGKYRSWTRRSALTSGSLPSRNSRSQFAVN